MKYFQTLIVLFLITFTSADRTCIPADMCAGGVKGGKGGKGGKTGLPLSQLCCPYGMTVDDTGKCTNPLTGAGCELCGDKLDATINHCPSTLQYDNVLARYGASAVTRVLTVMHEGMPAWPEFAQGKIINVDQHLQWIPTLIPEYSLTPFKMEWYCPVEAKNGCEAFIFQYTCATCTFAKGGLVGKLLNGPNPWTPSTRCSPRFQLDPTMDIHKMVTYKKDLQPGEAIAVDFDLPTEFVFFGLNVHSCAYAPCPGFCPPIPVPPPKGPWPKCTTCAKTDACQLLNAAVFGGHPTCQ